jgi:hypothetical protein
MGSNTALQQHHEQLQLSNALAHSSSYATAACWCWLGSSRHWWLEVEIAYASHAAAPAAVTTC